MQEIVVIDGEITLENVLDGEVELEAITDLDPEVVLSTGGAVYPHYSGSYEVTPSSSVQTLQTTDMVMDDDVTIEAVAQGSATTPATIITADPTISVSSGGLITATVSKTQQITPTVVEGYVSAGTAGNVGVSGSATEMLDTQAAQTIHPASTDQTIASGKYLTGAQTFKAVTVSGLTADKILQGNVVKIGDADDDDRIMSVTGTASGGITPTGTKSITANGTSIDVYNYQYADVAVPNSYSASDEGKVVSNGALVAQTSDTVTANDTYDTTLINSLTVNVSGGGGTWHADDGKTHLHINIESDFFKTVNMVFGQSVASGHTVDWGDGSAVVTPTNTTRALLTHSYAQQGEYEIVITNTSGYFFLGYGGSTQGFIFQDGVNNANSDKVGNYCSILRKVELGKGWKINEGRQFMSCRSLKEVYINTKPDQNKIGDNMFTNCNALESLTGVNGYLNSITSVGNYIFQNCASMTEAVIPPNITTISYGYMQAGSGYTPALTHLTIPSGVTVIGEQSFNYNKLLVEIDIPSTVTEIKANAFNNVYGVHAIHVRRTTPPTLGNANAFYMNSTNTYNQKIYVPYSADHSVLATYQTASNWSSLSSYLQEEPQ